MALTEHPPSENVAPFAADARELEELRRRAQQLETERDAALHLAEARVRWLAHVSHELRTPMNGILGMTQLALDSELSPEQREHLDLVRRSADSLMTLINDTLDHAKITSGRLAFEHIPFNLRDAVELATKTMEPSAAEKRIGLSLEIDPDLPLRMVGDPGRLRQVIFNLVGNAIKFTSVGGVTVAIRQQSCVADECFVHFTVRDTGIGIPPDRLASIFEPFEQAAANIHREYGGTGLGLAISRQLVEGMGGVLDVTSEVGAGTVFEFTLPFTVDDAPLQLGGSGGSLSDLRALVVSDGPINRHTLVEMLDAERMAGMVVENPLEARLYLRKARAAGHGFDLLILDLERDGLELAPGLMEDSGQAKTVFLTPSGQRGDAARCREMGIDAYLTGPVEVDDLTMAIRAVCDGAKSLVTRHWLRERRQPLSILLADDSETNRAIATRMLQRAGHCVTAVGDGRQAVDSFRRGRFDAVILDVAMPVMDGPTAAREIRAHAAGATVPIVALTGHIAAEDRDQLVAAGMDAVTPKPFHLHEVLAVLDRLIGSRATSIP